MTWRLSPAQLDVVWHELALGELPYPLQVPSIGATLDERADLRTRILDQLAAADLWHRGRLDAGLERALQVLARPELSLDSVWLPNPHAAVPCRVIAARIGDDAYLLAQDADPDAEFLIGEIRPTALELAVIDWLPGAPPGQCQPLSIQVGGAGAADDEDSVLVDEVFEGGGGGYGERAYQELAVRPRIGSGQLAVNTRPRSGGVRRSAVLHWFDVAGDGRYAAYRTDGYANVRPADGAWLHGQLQQLVASAG